MTTASAEQPPWKDWQVAVVGAGTMAYAVIAGAIEAGTLAPSQVVACRRQAAKLAPWGEGLGVRTTTDAVEAITGADVVFLAIKPQQAPDALRAWASCWRPGQRLVSVLAGTTLEALAAGLPGVEVARTMPNTPCLVGRGVTGWSASDPSAELEGFVRALFGAVGMVVRVPEQDLDALTALSGSGPAYVFRVMEAMAAGGVGLGLAPDVAQRLAVQTVVGAGALALNSDHPPGELRRQVTSPGGMTAEALRVFEAHNLGETFGVAMRAAWDRGQELAKLAKV